MGGEGREEGEAVAAPLLDPVQVNHQTHRNYFWPFFMQYFGKYLSI